MGRIYQLFREDVAEFICYRVYVDDKFIGRIELQANEQWEARDGAGIKHGQFPTVQHAAITLENLNG